MANVATASTVPVELKADGGANLYVSKVVCVMDTTGDFTIVSADANYHIGVVGIELSAPADCAVTIKSGSTAQVAYTLKEGSGLSKSIDGSVKYITAKNQALVINSDVALGTFTVYVQKFTKLQF